MSRRRQEDAEPEFIGLTPTIAEVRELQARVTTLEARVVDLEERHERDVRSIERRIGRVRADPPATLAGRVELSPSVHGSFPPGP